MPLRRVATVAATCVLFAVAARATTFTVNTELDDVDAAPGDGTCATSALACTLRAAIQESNVLPGADLILVPAGLYELSIAGTDDDLCASGDLDVLDAVTIRGAGASRSVIDGLELDRCIDVMSGPTDIMGLTLRRGGAWFGALPFGGGMALRDGVSVAMHECQVMDNGSYRGGGISVDAGASLTVDRTTISRNWCGEGWGGGGVQASESAVVLLLNTTVSGNYSGCGAGIAADLATVRLRNCTVTANSGNDSCGRGALAGTRFELANTIVAGNRNGTGCPDCYGALASLGYNLLGGLPTCYSLTGDLTGNVIGAPPMLGPLADNGGPVPTHALLSGSPAIDAGNPLAPGSGGVACEGEDQRGLARPEDGDLDGVSTCDIGAFEFEPETGRCADGMDNDSDALVDCSDPDCCADVGCAGAAETECCDGIDNECDGLIDRADPDCAGAPECPEAACRNRLDDDGDTLYDCSDPDCCGDVGCAGARELACCDRVDNDCDGLTDLADPDCVTVPECPELQCADGFDDDGDTLVDCSDPDCCATVACTGGSETECCDAIDNDCDGLPDRADPDCALVPECVEDCANGLDDDADALVDCADDECCADPACAGEPEAQCCDVVDNDCDGLTDVADPDCAAAPPCVEIDCGNGLDDDVDGLADCADPDCAAAPPCVEVDCGNGLDDDVDGLADCADPDCVAAPPCVEVDCADRLDNDGDALVDCADPDCVAAPPCVEVDCTNGVDDDFDARIDCADGDCSGTPSCDDDADGVPNGSDCAPDDPGAHSPPTEVPRLDVSRRADLGADVAALAWSDLSALTGPALVGDAFTGVITRMWADRSLVGASCLAGDLPAPQAIDARALPGPSDGFWYLVRAENSCGTGPLGSDSAGVPRDVGGMSCP